MGIFPHLVRGWSAPTTLSFLDNLSRNSSTLYALFYTHSPAVLDHSYSSLNSSLSYTPNSQPTVDETTASKTKNINLGPRNLMDMFVEAGD